MTSSLLCSIATPYGYFLSMVWLFSLHTTSKAFYIPYLRKTGMSKKFSQSFEGKSQEVIEFKKNSTIKIDSRGFSDFPGKVDTLNTRGHLLQKTYLEIYYMVLDTKTVHVQLYSIEIFLSREDCFLIHGQRDI